MNELVEKLTKEQPLVVSLRPTPNREALKAAIDRGWLLVKFTETRGGTELGFPIDRERSDFSAADLEQGTGTIRVAGELTLDYVRVRLVAKIDVGSFDGTGHLEALAVAEPAVADVGHG
jgi:hypothetical protein